MAWWVTRSGTTVAVRSEAEYQKPGDLGVYFDLHVSSTGGATRPITVRVDEPQYLNSLLQANSLAPLDQAGLGAAALVAGIRAVDGSPDFFASPDPVQVQLNYEKLTDRSIPPLGNKGLRRYIARRLYLTWEHGSFDEFLSFDSTDEALTGEGAQAFLRNLQLLEQEGYVELSRKMGTGFSSFEARPTAHLIREVERYGAAEGDAESEADFIARLVAQAVPFAEQPAVIAERRRYEVAQTADDVVSVFRALVPIVEGIVRKLLRAHGSKREHGSLGPMVGELVERKIGTRGLWSQLNAVLTNGRDISLHGEEVSIAVLRMAAETCFELVPQLAALFPIPAPPAAPPPPAP